ncbi:MAG TPA: Gfo/Idh/MocA family oxidoreductase, partial [Bryobacteraceae bacterium]|nr:Gfo/Idh/MocA family oxidoreductase [Bryobacteraceae bacterium]
MKRLRTALIGCGKVGQLHAAALRSLPQSEFVAVCDTNAQRAESFAAPFGVQAYTDPGTMVRDAKVQAVCLCTPHPLHAESAVSVMEAGSHILVEKPLAVSLEDCDSMIAAAARNGVVLGVVSQRRFFEPVRRMHQAIIEGKIGKPILGTVLMLSWRDEAYYRSDPWRGRWDTEGGGVLVNQAPHQLDILCWCMGPIEEVYGCWANLNHPYVEIEDTAVATIRFRNGGLGSIVASLSQRPGIYSKVHIHGSNGASVGVQTDTGATFIAGMSGISEPPLNDVWTIPGEEHRLSEFESRDREHFRTVNS